LILSPILWWNNDGRKFHAHRIKPTQQSRCVSSVELFQSFSDLLTGGPARTEGSHRRGRDNPGDKDNHLHSNPVQRNNWEDRVGYCLEILPQRKVREPFGHRLDSFTPPHPRLSKHIANQGERGQVYPVGRYLNPCPSLRGRCAAIGVYREGSPSLSPAQMLPSFSLC
jgi:hypothetical protein